MNHDHYDTFTPVAISNVRVYHKSGGADSNHQQFLNESETFGTFVWTCNQSLPLQLWRGEDLSITEGVKREDPSTTYHDQMGGAGTLNLCTRSTKKPDYTTVMSQKVRDKKTLDSTCFEVVTNGVLLHSRHFAGAVQHPELIHVQCHWAGFLRLQPLPNT